MLFGASFYDFNHHQKYILLSFEYGGYIFDIITMGKEV